MWAANAYFRKNRKQLIYVKFKTYKMRLYVISGYLHL